MEEQQYEPVVAPANGVTRMVQIFTAPSKAFDSIERKPNFLLPILAIVVVMLGVTFLTHGLLWDYTVQVMVNKGMDKQTAEAAMNQMQNIILVSTWMTSVFLFLIPIFKGIFAHVFSMMFGGEGKVGQSVSVSLNAYLISVLGTILALPIVMLTKNPGFTYSPAVILGPNQYGMPMHSLLSIFNIFTIWYLAVSIIGFKKVHKYSTIKASLAVLIPFAIVILMSLAGFVMGGKVGA